MRIPDLVVDCLGARHRSRHCEQNCTLSGSVCGFV
jgi:hypothetical protein